MTALPLQRTEFPGVYRRGSRFVVVYRVEGRQRKQAAVTLAEARAIKLARDAQACADRRGPTLHAYALTWLDRYAGSGHDSVCENTRREYRRLLTTFALTYFDRELRLGDLDRARVRQFVDWLTSRPGRDRRLRDRSIANAITPLRPPPQPRGRPRFESSRTRCDTEGPERYGAFRDSCQTDSSEPRPGAYPTLVG